jgi:hypothetical protein
MQRLGKCQVRTRAYWITLLLALSTTAVAAAPVEAASSPTLTLRRLIQTTPFVGAAWSMQDNEGSAYVPKNSALWMVDDEGQRIFVVNRKTGRLQRTIGNRALAAAHLFRGTTKAGASRTRDLESVAYDAARDRLYVFSGSDCRPSTANCTLPSRPAVFRFDRREGRLRLHSYQPLAKGSRPTAAAWNPSNGDLYVGDGPSIRSYFYKRNRYGETVTVSGLNSIFGMDFTRTSLVVAHDGALLSRVNLSTRSLAWTVDLSPFHVRDARAVEIVRGRLLVSDGADNRPRASRYRYAVFVFDAA